MNISPPAAPGAAKSGKGFTLVEVLVTLAVIAFGCLAALLMQSAALRGNSMADHMTVATFLAESEIERVKSLNFGELRAEISSLGTSRAWQADRFYKVCSPAGADACKAFPFTVTLRYFPGYPLTVSILTEVEVSWSDNSGRHSVHNSSTATEVPGMS
ncbi:MAG: prepilin-type N-terminal cleavage/methylation domain-containing protein [Deltaproteobacteria bacterium]|jgi:prepilin-type N-terminal cleavage/methylation domain-containing protein|nr:prepilin-type N-terminal cleavage/methylation domain-containing protein [Deltaproteobacteria bacterium]